MLVIERLPEALPIAVGAKLAVKVALCPSANINGSGGPLTVKCSPDATVWVIVKAAVPEFVRVRLLLSLEPIATFPKLRFVGVIPRFLGATHPDWIRATYNNVPRIRNRR